MLSDSYWGFDMAIYMPFAFTANILGDGSSTTLDVDFKNDIEQLTPFTGPMVPTGAPKVVLAFGGGSPVPSSATLDGTTVTFSFTTPPPSTNNGGNYVTVTLGF